MREQADPPAHRPALARQRAARARSPSRRAGAAAWRGSAAASSCRRRWRRRRRASRPAAARSRRRAGPSAPRTRARGRRRRPRRQSPWRDSPRSVRTAWRQHGLQHAEALVDGLRRAGEVDDRACAPTMPLTPRLSTAIGVCCSADGAHRLRDPGRLALDHRARRLRRDVVGRQAGPAGGEDEVAALVGVVEQPVLDQREVVRDDLHRDNFAARRLGPRGQQRARLVLRRAA